MAVMPDGMTVSVRTVTARVVSEDEIGRRVQVMDCAGHRAAGRITGVEGGLARVAYEDMDGYTVGCEALPYSREPRPGHWTDVLP